MNDVAIKSMLAELQGKSSGRVRADFEEVFNTGRLMPGKRRPTSARRTDRFGRIRVENIANQRLTKQYKIEQEEEAPNGKLRREEEATGGNGRSNGRVSSGAFLGFRSLFRGIRDSWSIM